MGNNIYDNQKSIQELKAGDKIDAFVLVKSYDVKKTTAGKLYVDLNLVDRTGEINAKIWENPKASEEILVENSIVKVRGEILEWGGALQLKVNKIRALLENENIQISQLVPSAPIEPNEMLKEVKDFADKIKDIQIRTLVNNILEKYNNKLLFYPAAKKNHHSYRGGLLYHVLRMLKTGEMISMIYGSLNTDYIFAGVILHDICKVLEMDSDDFGVVSDYTMEGKLLGHIIQGVKEIEIEGEKIGLDREKSIVLQHMILSHHYEPEYGSPKKPMTIESEVLHYLDIIDARMFDFENVLKGVEEGRFSDRVWVLDNRSVYKPIDNNIK
ncbi:HD domain-containing protein [Sedimentibacter sp. zth1]|uniref:3'-5' exoribonuclease YhaM family protein n=1 Tax=Sedimentibacter sp. zth1 TaxID=2816908 RepID=UPI001A917872|nr:HD domain-containing protein [Sedimentibacter sp. zth1]QSX07108.1 HD domain-containing protein [Sedimentibacter sp. zth1]